MQKTASNGCQFIFECRQTKWALLGNCVVGTDDCSNKLLKTPLYSNNQMR